MKEIRTPVDRGNDIVRNERDFSSAAEPAPDKASVSGCRARRTIASCAAAGSSWPTFVSPDFRTLPSCAARWRMRGSAEFMCRSAIAPASSPPLICTGVNPIRAVSGLPGFKVSEQPVLATGKVRQVGELVAMCVAPTRAEAEDIAAAVTLDLEELPAVYDMLKAREPGSALVHEDWGDNVFLETNFEVDISSALDAPIKVTRAISTARQCMSPLEGRGVVATFDHRLDQLTLYSGAQMPHITRNGLADCLGMEQGQIRDHLARTSAAVSATRAFCCRRKSACRG